MSNSSLIKAAMLSPNCNSPRNHEIDTITIHCAVGQLPAKRFAEMFMSTTRQASANYIIGVDGEIILGVEEKNRAWTSGNRENDNRAITIECACDVKAPYAVNTKVYNSLIVLCADICERNKIKELKWKGDKSLIGNVEEQNMTVHRWFQATACPGDYLYNKMGQIATDVNARICPKKSNEEIAKEVIRGVWGNGIDRKNRLTAAGYDYNTIQAIVNGNKVSTPVAKPVTSAKKSNEEIAKEVLRGDWGNGQDRKNRLTAAGYDYDAIQKIVNNMK